MAGAALRLLQDRPSAQRRHSGGNFIGLMAHHNKQRSCAQRPAGTRHVLDQRMPADAVQHFGQIRAQPRALASGQNYNNEVR
jgi:hypothetical protein